MTARNMVRNLRESGALETRPQSSGFRSVFLVIGLIALGALVYLAAIYGLPLLIDAMQSKPPPIEFAKKQG